jgi:hypothetical protein
MTRFVCTASVVVLVLLVLASITPSAAQDPQAKIKTASGFLLGERRAGSARTR